MAVIKNNNSNLIGYILLAAVIAGLSWLAYSRLDYRIEEVDKGFSGEALRNPYLAAEYFLRKMGQDAEEIKLFSTNAKAPSESDTVLIPGDRTAFNRRQSDELMEWVKSGGHLIITGRANKVDDKAARDFLLDPLGIHIGWKVVEGEDVDREQPVSVDIEDEDYFWLIDFVDYQVIEVNSSFDQHVLWTIEDNDRIHAVQLEIGSGRITLLSDMRIFRNEYIDKYNHAEFLYSLSNDQLRHSTTGRFLYSLFEDHMSLLEWLNENAKPLVYISFILIVFSLWMIVPRFGPIINIRRPVRRRFMDHLVASGNYHWRMGHYSRLLLSVRKQLSSQIQSRFPEWINLSRTDQIAQLSELSGMQSSSIENALFDTNIERVEHFVKKINVLEKLRKSI